ncbi:HEPN domain-containing protein [Candidatus Woesearchaeota archaeon]|nr:HEPN domain-containing protein [Candidatus Woesearchaeota archaeon]
MDSKVEMFLKRARGEIDAAEVLFNVSGKKELKEALSLAEESTFYSGAVSHAYYSIFYCAKAMLLCLCIETSSPDIHKKTFEKFKKSFVDTGEFDAKLFLIYQEMIVRAEALLGIYREEKKKRGDFTYHTIPQANREPAEQSLKNAKVFYKHCNAYLSEYPKG